MKSIKLVLLLIATLASHAFARVEGPSSGGGGFVIKCESNALEPNGYLELLDLYRGRRLGLQIANPTGDVGDDYFNAVKRTYELQGNITYNGAYADQHRLEIIENMKGFMRQSVLVDSSSIPKTSDYGDVFIPSGCNALQIAYYDDKQNTLKIDKNLWNQITSIDKAALIHHELFFKFNRDSNSYYSSKQTALFVAHVYAVNNFAKTTDGILPTQALEFIYRYNPSNPNSTYGVASYYVTRNPTGGVRLQLNYLNSFPLVAKTWVDLPLSGIILSKYTGPDVLYGFCKVATENVDVSADLPIQGNQVDSLKYRIVLKTGKLVQLQLIDGSTEVPNSAGYLNSQSLCP